MRFDCVWRRPAVSMIATSLPARPRRLDGIEGHGGRVRAARRADEVRLRALGPDLELLLRGCAKGVGCTHEHRAAVLVELACELPDRRRLAGAVDPYDEDHARPRGECERRRVAEERLDLVDERVFEVAGHSPSLEPANELGGRRDADVAPDQRLLEPLPRLVVGGVESRRLRARRSARRGSSRASRASARRSPSARARRTR